MYDYIDSSSFYINSIELSSRSRMNVPFDISDESLNDLFLSEAHHNGLFELKKGTGPLVDLELRFIMLCLLKALEY